MFDRQPCSVKLPCNVHAGCASFHECEYTRYHYFVAKHAKLGASRRKHTEVCVKHSSSPSIVGLYLCLVKVLNIMYDRLQAL